MSRQVLWWGTWVPTTWVLYIVVTGVSPESMSGVAGFFTGICLGMVAGVIAEVFVRSVGRT